DTRATANRGQKHSAAGGLSWCAVRIAQVPGKQTAGSNCVLGVGCCGIAVCCLAALVSRYNLQGYRIKPHGQLVLVSSMHYCTSTPSLSTSWSRTTLQGALGPGIPNLQTSFPLRCLQRLSLPYLAT